MSSLFSAATIVVMIAACGAKDDKSVTQKPSITEEEAKAAGAALPAMTIVKVPVDANGKEMHDDAELRLAPSATALTADNAATTFALATAPQAGADELDQTSSTESYCGWAGWRRAYRRAYYAPYYNNWNWQYYRPTYINQGYNYGYNYGGHVNNACNTACYTNVCNPCGGVNTASNTTTYSTSSYNQTPYGVSSYNYYYYNSSFNQNGYSGTGWNPSVSYQNTQYSNQSYNSNGGY